MTFKYFILIFTTVLISCAITPKFNTKNIELSLTPQQVVKNAVATRGKNIIWGGTILDIRNLKKETQIEILAYPLDSSHRPLTDKKPLGRFIILHFGYLEPATYEQGKQLSVQGKVNGIRSGEIGDSIYKYALIKSKQLHLWSKENETQTFFHFGIGIQM